MRIILANEPRLFREMLHRAINRVPGLEIVEATNPAALREMVEQNGAQWIVIPLNLEGEIAETITSMLRRCARVGILAMSPDGSRAKIKWLELHEQILNDLTLDQLIGILQAASPGKFAMPSDVLSLEHGIQESNQPEAFSEELERD